MFLVGFPNNERAQEKKEGSEKSFKTKLNFQFFLCLLASSTFSLLFRWLNLLFLLSIFPLKSIVKAVSVTINRCVLLILQKRRRRTRFAKNRFIPFSLAWLPAFSHLVSAQHRNAEITYHYFVGRINYR